MNIPIRKYSQDWEDEDFEKYFDESDVPAEVQSEIVEQYNEMRGEDWKRRVEFLNKIMDDYTGTGLEGWAADEKSEIVDYELPLRVEEMIIAALKANPKGKWVVDYFEPHDWTGEITYETFKGRGTLEENVAKSLPQIIQTYWPEAQEDIKDARKRRQMEQEIRFIRPEDEHMMEVPTEPKKLENVPSDQGLGSVIPEPPEPWRDFIKRHKDQKLSCRSVEMKKEAVSQSHLIRALKDNDTKGVKRALSEYVNALPWGVRPEDELGMTEQEYKDFVKYISLGELKQARDIFGVEKDEGLLDIIGPKEEKKLDEIAENDKKQKGPQKKHVYDQGDPYKELADAINKAPPPSTMPRYPSSQYPTLKNLTNKPTEEMTPEEKEAVIRNIEDWEEPADDGIQIGASKMKKNIKQAIPEESMWEWENIDKANKKLIEIFSEFVEHRKAHNHSTAEHLADILIHRIPEHTSEIVHIFNRDAKENPPSDAETEKTVERLKLWNGILKDLEQYIRKAKPYRSKEIGPKIIRKKQEANMLVELYKIAYSLDKKGEYDMADEVDRMIETLAKRVGLKEMVALADYFDEIEDYASADMVDSMVRKTTKK